MSNSKPKLVIFDLGTRGLVHEEDYTIWMIAARCGDEPFSVLCEEDFSIPEALKKFIDFLQRLGSTDIALVAHNCHFFDGPIILEAMEKHGLLGEFRGVVKSFVDSLPAFREKCRHSSYALRDLAVYAKLDNAETYLDRADVRAHILQQLQTTMEVTDEDLMPHARSVEYISKIASIRLNLPPRVPDTLIVKIVNAGITLDELLSAHKEDPINGLRKLFTEPVNGMPRVTDFWGDLKDINCGVSDYVVSLKSSPD